MIAAIEPSVLEECWHMLNNLLFAANWFLFVGGMLATVVQSLRSHGRFSGGFMMFGSLCNYTHIVAAMVFAINQMCGHYSPPPDGWDTAYVLFFFLFVYAPSLLGVSMWWFIRRRAVVVQPADKLLGDTKADA